MVEDSLRGVLRKSNLNRKVPASRPAQVVGGGGGRDITVCNDLSMALTGDAGRREYEDLVGAVRLPVVISQTRSRLWLLGFQRPRLGDDRSEKRSFPKVAVSVPPVWMEGRGRATC